MKKNNIIEPDLFSELPSIIIRNVSRHNKQYDWFCFGKGLIRPIYLSGSVFQRDAQLQGLSQAAHMAAGICETGSPVESCIVI